MGAQYGVVWLDDRRRDLWSWVNCKLQFRLLSVVCCQAFEKESPKARACASTKGMEYQEALEGRAIV